VSFPVRTVRVALLLLAAALAQGALVARLPWPGPGEPLLPALAVLAVAFGRGPRSGAVAGFMTGLTLDVLPPASHAVGQWAFVLCLLGHLVGLLAQDVADSALFAVALGTLGAAVAPLVFTLVGIALGDPRADLVRALERLPSVALSTLVLAVVVLGPLRWRRRDRVISAAAAPGGLLVFR
jgi:rod shape-determining protein MreD